MVNSQIQQGNQDSAQLGPVDSHTTDSAIKAFLQLLKECLSQLNLVESQLAEVQAEIATIETQMRSPRPKSLIIAESLKTLRNILEGTTGSLVATSLLETIRILAK